MGHDTRCVSGLIREGRKALRIQQTELARRIYCSRQLLSLVELDLRPLQQHRLARIITEFETSGVRHDLLVALRRHLATSPDANTEVEEQIHDNDER